MAQTTVFVNQFTNGILDPSKEMLGPLQSGGRIVVNTAPGCWGPMLTPAIRGGHEVSVPVFVEGAQLGDAVAIYIETLCITSSATASGTDLPVEGRYKGDPFVAGQCHGCGELYPKTYLDGTGAKAVKCAKCGSEAAPFTMPNGYTMVFDTQKTVGVTLGKSAAEAIAQKGKDIMQLPEHSIQNPVVSLAPAHLPGIATRLRPFIGQLGTTPAHPLPDSHNAGDFGAFLLNASHEYSQTEESLKDKTDGHMDINKVRPGAVLVCPVKVAGAGIYVGDVHALQGEGEIAGHTCDVSAISVLRVELIKNLSIDGPILFPVLEDLPYLSRPLSETEKAVAMQAVAPWDMGGIEDSLPLSFVGTGADLNKAIENGLQRASVLLEMSLGEIQNRVTITGAIEIGRVPGVVTVTLRVPLQRMGHKALAAIARAQYCL